MDSPIWGMMMSVGMISFHAGPRFRIEGRMQTNYYSGSRPLTRDCILPLSGNCPEPRAPVPGLSLLLLLFTAWGRYAEAGLPVVLHGGRQLFHVREEAGDLPHILLAESFFPGGHAGITNAGADGVEDMPLGVVGWVGDEIGSWRVEGVGERSRFPVECTVTDGAVHGVELHAIFKVLVAGGQRIGDVGSVALHGCIHRGISQVMFPAWWWDVGVGGEEAERGEPESAENEYEKSEDYAENKFAH